MIGMRYLKNVVTLELDVERCNGCSLCAIVCPHAVFEIAQHKARIVDLDACMECGACQKNCPEDAIDVRSGVGCATGIISSWLAGSEEVSCDCSEDGSCC